MKVCLVSSVGGHLEQIMEILPAIEGHERFYVVNDRKELPPKILSQTRFLTKSQRDWRLLLNVVEAYRIVREERPDLVVSTGAGPAVPIILWAKLFGARIVFIEVYTAVDKPTLTGRIVYPIADLFVYLWEDLRRYYPRGVYGGPCFDVRDGG